MSASTTNAAHAKRLQQLRSEQISAALKLEATGKGGGTGSVALLVREEWNNDESLLHQFLRYLQVHCMAVQA